jgi:hypothetical protein
MVMPVMPRQKNRARKIAYKVLGIPNNIKYKKSPYTEAVARRLLFEDTSRQR